MMRQATPPGVECEYFLEGFPSWRMLSLDRTLVDAPRKHLCSRKAFWVMPWGMLSAVNEMTHFSEKAKPTACFQVGQRAHPTPLELKQNSVGLGGQEQIMKHPAFLSKSWRAGKSARWQASHAARKDSSGDSCGPTFFVLAFSPPYPCSSHCVSISLSLPLLVVNFLILSPPSPSKSTSVLLLSSLNNSPFLPRPQKSSPTLSPHSLGQVTSMKWAGFDNGEQHPHNFY